MGTIKKARFVQLRDIDFEKLDEIKRRTFLTDTASMEIGIKMLNKVIDNYIFENYTYENRIKNKQFRLHDKDVEIVNNLVKITGKMYQEIFSEAISILHLYVIRKKFNLEEEIKKETA